ncbi:NAD(P)/FAD-dependent oxidoreductase [Uliginosibacterium sp. H1]|uniref:NAD(P)/FAD-dependent oxidoreductase n=1 Tax=Uliginosibacterium sp. H1 TaxID=3114757 RepID=UPI002E1959DA|nr:FAD-dependent oxidoreductase [Uliginosibacterium sp. H1]
MTLLREGGRADAVQDIAVIGSGISGLSAAWLLSRRHRVTLFEAAWRAGGHSNTVVVRDPRQAEVPVDTGFIVYNEATYPNLHALFSHLGVQTRATDMSFAVSLGDGALEYAGTDLNGLFAQRRNLFSPRFWSMLVELVRFYRQAPGEATQCGHLSLDEYLDQRGYGAAFRHDHLYPMAAAIWSAPATDIGRYPVAAFVRFCENHNLLKLSGRPPWRTVVGGSREYVQRMSSALGDGVRLCERVLSVQRDPRGVSVATAAGTQRFDHAVVATHADEALRLLDQPTTEERALLGAFAYSDNRAVLHSDPALMPRRRQVWSSWNYLSSRRDAGQDDDLCVTYWMNLLQGLPQQQPFFVTLNPVREPAAERVWHREHYTHPLFDTTALDAQQQLWSLQGRQRTWFCGAYFGAGFHEDGLQAGLAVAEALGGVRRPWSVANESGRIPLPVAAMAQP